MPRTQDVSVFDETTSKGWTILDKDAIPAVGDNAGLVKDVSFKLISVGIKQTAMTVTTTAVKLPTTPLTSRKSLTIFNNNKETLFIGDSSVTSSDGYPIKKKKSISIDIDAGVDVYGVTDSGTTDVRILEVA